MNNRRLKTERRRRPAREVLLERVERDEVEDHSQQGEQAASVGEIIVVQLVSGIMNAQDEAIEKTQCPREPRTIETVDDNIKRSGRSRGRHNLGRHHICGWR
jgi:hypothetical protein